MRLYHMPTQIFSTVQKRPDDQYFDAIEYLEEKYKLYGAVGPSFIGKIPFEVGDEKLLTLFLLEWAQ